MIRRIRPYKDAHSLGTASRGVQLIMKTSRYESLSGVSNERKKSSVFGHGLDLTKPLKCELEVSLFFQSCHKLASFS